MNKLFKKNDFFIINNKYNIMNNNYKNIQSDKIIYIDRFINFFINKYNLNNIYCMYSNKYKGYIIKINQKYLFIDNNIFDKFIQIEKIRELTKDNICKVINNNLDNNVINVLLNSYYFNNYNDLKLLNSIYKNNHKINNMIEGINIFLNNNILFKK